MASRFLKLSKMVINTNHIRHIEVNPKKIILNIGQSVGGLMMFGSGELSTNYIDIDIEKKDEKGDYEIAKEWIDKL